MLGFPRVHASYTRQNNSKKIYIHHITPWVAFKKFKESSSNLLWFLKLCPSFVCLSIAIGCSKPTVSTVEHLQKWSTPEIISKSLMGQVFKTQKFPLRKKEEISKRGKKRRENLTHKFSFPCCVFNWSFPLPFIGY